MTEQELNQIVLPRLQIKCTKVGDDYKEKIWNYELVYKHFTGDPVYISLGVTAAEGGNGSMPLNDDGTIDLPFRDGAHIKNEAVQLRLPAYAICENIVQKIDLSDFISKFPEKVHL